MCGTERAKISEMFLWDIKIESCLSDIFASFVGFDDRDGVIIINTFKIG